MVQSPKKGDDTVSKNLSDTINKTVHAYNVLTEQIDDYYKGVQDGNVRKADSETAIINMEKQFREFHSRLDVNEIKQAASEKFSNRITIATFVVAVLALIASIVVPVVIAVITG